MSDVHDPFRILGIDPTKDEQEIRRAWRRLARTAHPDAGGSDARMQQVNTAMESAIAHARSAAEERTAVREHRRGPGRRVRSDSSRVRRDASSFTIDVPVMESFRALEIVGSEVGSVIHGDPPGCIEFTLHQSSIDEGGQSWCLCELVPEAGATTVHVTVGSDPASAAPSVDAVRDVLVAALNSIDWPPFAGDRAAPARGRGPAGEPRR